jgi:hypothetical protein
MPVVPKDSSQIPQFLDEISIQMADVKGKEMTLVTQAGSFSGHLEARTQVFAVLKTMTNLKIADGPQKGKSIFEFQYVAMNSIVAILLKQAGEE